MTQLQPDLTIDGLYKIPVAEYDAHPAMRQSHLKKILKTPLAYKAYVETPQKPTDALVLGNAVHTLILEPEREKERIAVFDGATRRGVAYNKLVLANPGKDVITQEMYDQACAMADSFAAHPLTRDLLDGAELEQSCFWQDFVTELDCKARFDIVKGGVLYDIKTTLDASEEKWLWSCKDYDYRFQTAWYLDGMSAVTGEQWDRFVFVCIEKTPPYDIQLFEAHPYFVQLGRKLCREARQKYVECVQKNEWPGYSHTIKTVSITDRELMEVEA